MAKEPEISSQKRREISLQCFFFFFFLEKMENQQAEEGRLFLTTFATADCGIKHVFVQQCNLLPGTEEKGEGLLVYHYFIFVFFFFTFISS